MDLQQNRYKLIALDIDGTILTTRHTIAPETREAVQAALARGVRVTLATGRAFPSARFIAAALGLHGTPLVTHDGAYVADPHTGQVLAEVRIPVPVARQAAIHLQELGLAVNFLYEDIRVSNQRVPLFSWTWLHPRYWAKARHILQESRVYPHRYAPDLAAYLDQSPVAPPKLYVTGQPDQIRRGKAVLEERLGNDLRVTPAGPDAMEVTPRHVSKASGLRVLAQALGIRPEEVIGIGDNYNDAEMIAQAGLGVAMGNAPSDVKRLAKFVTRTNDEHGVAYAIRRFVLEQAC
jgi:Cof subfamily protein (haloacid dehalogenase superfamily)